MNISEHVDYKALFSEQFCLCLPVFASLL